MRDENFFNKLRLIYENVDVIGDTSAVVRAQEGQYCVHKHEEKIVKSEVFENYIRLCPYNNCIQVSIGGKYGVVSDEATTIVPIKYTKVLGVSSKLIIADVINKSAVYDTDGKEVLKPMKYKHIGFYGGKGSEPIIIAIGGKKQYALDITGKIIIEDKIVDNRYLYAYNGMILRTHALYYSRIDKTYEGDTKPKFYSFKGDMLKDYTDLYIRPLGTDERCVVEQRNGCLRHNEKCTKPIFYVGEYKY